MTLNNSWGYCSGDTDWKSPHQIIDCLARAASGNGNLVMNIGPRGDGSIPEASVEILKAVGGWLAQNKEAIYDTDYFDFDLLKRGEDRSDWNHLGPLTAKGNCFYWLIRRWPGGTAALGGVQVPIRRVSWLDSGREVGFQQTGTRVVLRFPDNPPDSLCPVLKFECGGVPMLYQTGGMRVPRVDHPHYDPGPSDMIH
jgi:alpha-L-fucosidase